ncbi:UbiA prenyltransferase family-domain-containing protein [Hypoxylon crocopeplum]|nr:UbiA prenyltransferase family-domain-containing protein [Hypoxylon crocopeplum]
MSKDDMKSSPVPGSLSKFHAREQPNGFTKMPKSIWSQLGEIVSLAYLITESNIKAYVLPVMLFAMLSIASSAGVTTNLNPNFKDLAVAFPRATLYIWLYVLHFDCSNQKDPSSIEEDRLNKPWRAIPSGKLSIEGAERWYKAAACLLLLASGTFLGGFPEALAFMLETYIYDYASGSSSWWGKNLINALFYMTGQLGTTRVAAESMESTSMARAGFEWCALLGLEVFSTVQIQDLRDQKGDSIKGRRTMPLVLGDVPTRWITAVFIIFWSVALPLYWSNGAFTLAYISPILIGAFVSVRILSRRSPKEDRMSSHYYTLLWLPALYAIPLLSQCKVR